MKIAYVNTEYLPVPPTRGGAVEEWIDRIAQSLPSHQVFVFSLDKKRKKTAEQKGQVKYFWYKPGFIANLMLSNYRLPFRKDDSKWLFYPYASWCANKLAWIKPDIIHLHNRPHFVWLMKKKNPKAKILLHLHQVSAFEEPVFWTKEFIDSVDLFVGCSQFIINELCNRYPVPKEKTTVFYNALDMAGFPTLQDRAAKRKNLREEDQLADKKVLLYVGRLVENKGVHFLLEAVRNLVVKGHTDLILIVCGARGYASRDMTSYIQKLYNIAYEVNENILFKGFIPHEKILNYYLKSDLVVIPSEVQEGFCLITIEGMASGVPVLASKRGGIPEIVLHGRTGNVVDDPSSENFERAIKLFIDRPDIFQRYQQPARLWVEEKFTWNKVSQTVEHKYKEMIGNGRVNL